jgi:formylglycine-generating enzyme required for sulfatase activity
MRCFFVFLAFSFAGFSASRVSIFLPSGQKKLLYEGSYALVIGNSDYSDGWPDLPGVAKDVKAVAKALRSRGFLVEDHLNLDRPGMEQAFERFIARYGTGEKARQNRLLFYYAGHGETLKPTYSAPMGYLVPRDAPLKSDRAGFRLKALKLERVNGWAKDLDALHALFLFDSCFSGALFALAKAAPATITYSTSKPVRQFITSGSANETVPDDGQFAALFVSALQGRGDLNGDTYITGTELGSYLRDAVINYSNSAQHPQYGKIRDRYLDEGDFVFDLQNTTSVSSFPPRIPPYSTNQALPLYGPPFPSDAMVATPPPSTHGAPTPSSYGLTGGSNQTSSSYTNSIGMQFKLIPSGSFTMGSPLSQSGRNTNEGPTHQVQITRPFYLAKFEVTQGQWEDVMGQNPSIFRGCGRNCPVEQVSWNDVKIFISKLNQREGCQVRDTTARVESTGLYSIPAGCYRLPTGAEWEYGAGAFEVKSKKQKLGGSLVHNFMGALRSIGRDITGKYSMDESTKAYYWGNQMDGSYAWYSGNAAGKTNVVGQKKPNAWGLYDMSGNVSEWVFDREAPYQSSTQIDPVGPRIGSNRVSRGGSWHSYARKCRTASREGTPPDFRYGNQGFRLLRVASP